MAIFIPILKPIFQAKELIITYGLKPFDICESNAKLWQYIKIMYIITFFTSNLICSNFVYNKIPIKKKTEKHLDTKNKDDKLKLLIGYNQKTKEKIYIPKSGLFQNFLITGTIGSGKTSSAMYPFTKQLIKYNYLNPNNKIGMLILDVKGNYYNQVKKYVKKYNLEDDLIVIELKSKITYNPLNKPSLKPIVLANRLKTILELFSENNSESYWLDKAEQILAEAIKLCRIYNDGYVTFKEIHNLITIPNYYKEKIQKLKELFILNKLSLEQIYELNMALNFFEREFQSLDPRTSSILKSEITRITNTFISDYNVLKTFSPEIMKKLNNNNERITAFICDEYAEYVTKTDSDFFALSREAKCINIVSTQSYSSLKNTLKDETSVKVICQNLINKIWFRTDDIFTIEEAQKQLGKEEKEKISKNISESAKKTKYNYLTKSLVNKDSSISESLNIYTQNDYVYDTNFFTLELETFNSLCFLSDGNKILKPTKIKMYPYFLEEKEELL